MGTLKKQTAVEWLVSEIKSQLIKQVPELDLQSLQKQAKEMEKEQIMEAAERWKGTDFAELYYNETYGGDE